MNISAVNGSNTGMMPGLMNQAEDPVSRNIQKQIVNLQKQMQGLSENKDMSLEEKMKKRQELQMQISDLQNQLRQHQIDSRREKQQDKQDSVKSTGQSNGKTNEAGVSEATMTAIISADASMDQIKIHGAAKSQIEGSARVMRTEAKLDKNGKVAEKKLEKAAELEGKAAELETEQMKKISEAGNEIRKAAETDRRKEKSEKPGIGSDDERTEFDKETKALPEFEYKPVNVISDGFPERVVEVSGNNVDEKR